MANVVGNPYIAKFRRKFSGDEELRRYIAALYELLSNALGADKIVLRAGTLGALQRLVFEDPTLERLPTKAQYRETLAEIEDGLADLIAQRTVEDNIERKISEKMALRHQEYLKDLKLEAIKEDGGPETPATQRKLDELKALDERGLAASALSILRPTKLDQIVGQEAAIAALLAKIASPFPQHVILFGPPGVGKTTVARLALEAAK